MPDNVLNAQQFTEHFQPSEYAHWDEAAEIIGDSPSASGHEPVWVGRALRGSGHEVIDGHHRVVAAMKDNSPVRYTFQRPGA